jgi:hypothetical protein
VQERELVPAIQDQTALATATIVRLLRAMEGEGVLEGRFDGMRKAYGLPGAPASPAARPPPPWASLAVEPEPAEQAVSVGRRRELVAVVAALLVAGGIVALVLAPDKGDDTAAGGGSAAPGSGEVTVGAPAKPAPAPATPKPYPKANPKAKARDTGALAAAKRTQVAVLSASSVPGIAAKTGAALKRRGFRVGPVTNGPGPSASSLVLYARGKKAEAGALARSANISAVRPANPNFQALAPKAGLIVVVGADRRR